MDWFLYDNGLRHERVNHLKQVQKMSECIQILKTLFKGFSTFNNQYTKAKFSDKTFFKKYGYIKMNSFKNISMELS